MTPEQQPPENVLLVCNQCRGREWVLRGDCVLECSLCEHEMDMAELVREHEGGTGHWMNTDN